MLKKLWDKTRHILLYRKIWKRRLTRQVLHPREQPNYSLGPGSLSCPPSAAFSVLCSIMAAEDKDSVGVSFQLPCFQYVGWNFSLNGWQDSWRDEIAVSAQISEWAGKFFVSFSICLVLVFVCLLLCFCLFFFKDQKKLRLEQEQ